MSAGEAGRLVPTFVGFVENSMDGLTLFEACLIGGLSLAPRRPHGFERSRLIRSGNIFIYDKTASGIERWTDGVAWSPSRILGNFLIYRELDKPFTPGEKKRAIKREHRSLCGVDDSQRGDPDSQENLVEMARPITPPEPPVNREMEPRLPGSEQDEGFERSLVGSLTDSYVFRAGGLVKKTMSISIDGISHHMVSYYTVDDVIHNVLGRPLQDPRLQHISVRPELYLKQNFRAPIKDTEHYAIDGSSYVHPQMMHLMTANGQAMTPGQYYPQGNYPGIYAPMAMSNAGPAAMYSAMPGTRWAQQPASVYFGHPGYTAASSYENYHTLGFQADANPADPHDNSQMLGYSNFYSASYSGVQRDGSHSLSRTTPQSNYQTPVQLGSSTFGYMSAPTGRPSYSASVPSRATNGQSHQMYGGPQSQQ